ncbi:uncharacterized protein LOC143864865 isoform X2 [Tasmannia lanceolata]
MLTAYDLLDQFCEFIILHLPYIRRNRDLPNDINEALSSLIFAAARCAELPELQILRKLFGERYGIDFAVAAVELFPGTLVSRKIIEKLCVRTVSDDVKLRFIEEIAGEYSLQLGCPDTEDVKLQHQQVYSPLQNMEYNWNKGFSERNIQLVDTDIRGAQMMQPSNPYQKKKLGHIDPPHEEARSHDLSSNCKKLVADPISHTTVGQCSPDIVDPLNYPLTHRIPQDVENLMTLDPLYDSGMASDTSLVQSDQGLPSLTRLSTSSHQHKVERTTTEGTASESSTQFLERFIVYLDDEDDLRTCKQEDREGNDEKCWKSDEKNFVSASNPLQSKLETEIARSQRAEKHTDGHGTFESSSRACRASLSDLHHYDSAENHLESKELHDRRAISTHSSKRKSVGQSSEKRSISRHKQAYQSGSYNIEFGDLLGTNRSRSRKIHNQRVYSSMPVALSMKDVEYALYYDDNCDYSDIDSPGCKWKTNGPNGDQFIQGSMLNSELGFTTSRMIHRKKCHQEMSNGGIRTYPLRGDEKKPRLPQRSNCPTLVELSCEELQSSTISHRCEYNRSCYRNMVPECCLEHPCCFLANDDAESPSSKQRSGGTDLAGFSSSHNLRQKESQKDRHFCCHSHPNEEASNCTITICHETCSNSATKKKHSDKTEDKQVSDQCNSNAFCCKREVQVPSSMRPPYLRAVTMPPERPKMMNQTLRCASFQQQPTHGLSTSSSYSSHHIHPKLPDYDDLAAKFMALKKQNLTATVGRVNSAS